MLRCVLVVALPYASCLARPVRSGPARSGPGRAVGRLRATSVAGGANVLAQYDAALTARPLLTKCASSGLASACGDALAQSMSPSPFDVGRCVAFALVGALYFAPLLHGWYEALAGYERRWRSRGLGRRESLLLQLAINQTLGALLANCGFFYALALAEDACAVDVSTATAARATRALRDQLWTVMRANWVVWPLPALVNLAFVPLRYRVLWTNAVAVVWKCVLSLITKGP